MPLEKLSQQHKQRAPMTIFKPYMHALKFPAYYISSEHNKGIILAQLIKHKKSFISNIMYDIC